MAEPTINWSTKVITVPQSYLTLVSGSLYELDVDAFRLSLKNIEDSEEGMAFLDTHRHNTEVELSGVTYSRTFEIINGYTVTFEDGAYSVRCVGANHNIGDVKNVNQVSLIIGNSAGLITVSSGSGLSSEEHGWLEDNLSSVENSRDLASVVRLMKSALLGATTNDGKNFWDEAGTTQRFHVTLNTDNERVSVTIDNDD